jgi:hypothetical protein
MHCRNHQIDIIIGVDANAHNVVWGSKWDCPRGVTLLDYLATNNLELLNVGNSPTWEKEDSQDVIDITFCTQNISDNIKNWQVLKNRSWSDHNIISMELDAIETSKEKFRNKKKTNWIGYRAALAKRLSLPIRSIDSKEDLDREADFLTKSFLEAYHNNCKLIRRNTKTKRKWQSVELLNQRKEVRKLHNIARRRKTDREAWKTWKEKRNEYEEGRQET